MVDESVGATGEGASDRPGRPDPRPGLSKRSRVVILVVVLGSLALLGLVVGNRNRDAYDHTMTRVQVEAKAEGDVMDLEAFKAAWAQQLVDEGNSTGDEKGPASALVPEIPGAGSPSFTVSLVPVQVIVDYPVDQGGQQGCVRLVRTADGTTVLTENTVCAHAFLGGS